MRRAVVRVAVLGVIAASLSVVSGSLSPALARGASGTIELVSPAEPVLLGSAITVQGQFKRGANRAFVIQQRKYLGKPWKDVAGTEGTTAAHGLYSATFTPKHTFQYRAVLPATAKKKLRYTKKIKVQLTATWSQVSAGADHTCGIRPDQKLWCWGDNGYGDVGNDNAPYPAEVPVKVKDKAITSTQTWLDVSAGFGYTCGVRTDNTLWCWGGDNAHGELGLGDTTPRAVPVQVGTDTDWASVETSDVHTCAIKTDKSLWCWGDNSSGELGLGTSGGKEKQPQPVDDSTVNVGASQSWLSVSLGTQYTCGIRDDDTLWCWGYNRAGEMGVDPLVTGFSSSPVQIAGSWSAVSASFILADPTYSGLPHTCGIKTDQSLWCWGDDTKGQLGDNTTSTSGTTGPQQVGSATDWTSVSAGGASTCGIENGTDLHCWGYNYWGQLGNGSMGLSADTGDPTTTVVAGYAGQTWTGEMSVGTDHACGIGDDSTLWCWGWNGDLQLGTGTYPPRNVPTVTDAG